MSYPCEVVDLPERPSLSIRARTSVAEIPRMLGSAYGAVMQYLSELREEPAGPPFAIYYNTDMENLDVEAGFPVARPLPGKGDVVPGNLPAGRAAVCMHVGPYPGVDGAYGALTRWVAEQGLQPSGVACEIYLNDPNETPPERLRTQIVFPLRG